MRTFTCRSTFLYGVYPEATEMVRSSPSLLSSTYTSPLRWAKYSRRYSSPTVHTSRANGCANNAGGGLHGCMYTSKYVKQIQDHKINNKQNGKQIDHLTHSYCFTSLRLTISGTVGKCHHPEFEFDFNDIINHKKCFIRKMFFCRTTVLKKLNCLFS